MLLRAMSVSGEGRLPLRVRTPTGKAPEINVRTVESHGTDR